MTKACSTYDAWRQQTKLIHGGIDRSAFQETSEALFLTSGYIYNSAEEAMNAFKGRNQRYIYSRYSNPTVTMFQNRLALLEGSKYCLATSSGMAAVFGAIASNVQNGDRVIASRALFGSCHYILSEILPSFGIEVIFVDGSNPDHWSKAFEKGAKCVFLETPSNPTLEIIDIQLVSKLAHEAGAIVIVDNVFASPILQKPLSLGADIVVYSATKHIDGQGRSLGGAILTNNYPIYKNKLMPFLRHTGPALSPFNSWILLKGLETLGTRMSQHCKNSLLVAKFLQSHPKVRKVLYPNLREHPQYELATSQMSAGGSIITFEAGASQKSAFSFLNSLNMIRISNNLGDVKSLITHPATTTHHRFSSNERMQLGITRPMVRLSVGLEDVEDIKEDIDHAFNVLS